MKVEARSPVDSHSCPCTWPFACGGRSDAPLFFSRIPADRGDAHPSLTGVAGKNKDDSAQSSKTRGSRLVVVAAFETYPQSGRALIQTYFSELLKRIPRITVLKAELLKRIPRF